MTQVLVAAFAPGRANLIGEHTDYNEGLALPFALAEGVTVTAERTAGEQMRIRATDLGEDDTFPVAQPTRITGWRAFARGAVAELSAIGVPVAAATLSIASDIPPGAGLSSSAALEVAICLAIIACSQTPQPDLVSLARVCQRIEHNWVGAQTGLLDPLACLGSTVAHALLIDFRSLETEAIPMALGGHQLVLLDSGQRRQNAGSVYNERREECFEAAHRMGRESLRDAHIQDLHLLPDTLERRARHVITENGRVEQAVTALRTHAFHKLGLLLNLSHASLRDDFEVSTDYVEHVVSRLLDAGALGARMTGGGSGGYVLGLMPPGAQIPADAWKVSASASAHLLTEV